MKTRLFSYIVLSILLEIGLMSCHGVNRADSTMLNSDGTVPETIDHQSHVQTEGSASAVPKEGTSRNDITPEMEYGEWQIYRNKQYSLVFKYPPVYSLRIREKTAEPDQLLQITLLTPDAIGSPLEDRIPPAFAIDIYENSARRSVEEWMEKKRIVPDVSRYGVSVVSIGGIPGVRVADRAQLAPNIFYYIAYESYVYRFTPLGLYSEQILESVKFDP